MIIAYINCLSELSICLSLISKFPKFVHRGSLFPRSEFSHLPEVGLEPNSVRTCPDDALIESQFDGSGEFYWSDLADFYELEGQVDLVKQEHFYGRCLGFYLCPSAQVILEFLVSVMAGYGNSFLVSLYVYKQIGLYTYFCFYNVIVFILSFNSIVIYLNK